MSDQSNSYAGSPQATQLPNVGGEYVYPPPSAYGAPTPGSFPAFASVSGIDQRRNGLGIAALVLGIVGLVMVWLPFLSLLLGILATALGGVGLGTARQGKTTGKGSSIAGLTLGIITVVLAFLSLTLAVVDYIDSIGV